MADRRDELLDHIDPASLPPTSWRSEIRGGSGLNVLLAIWLMFSPWVLAYRESDPTWIQFVLADVIALLAVLRVTGAWWEAWMSWANAVVGAVVFLVGAFVAESGQATFNAMVGGTVAIMLAAFSASATASARGRR